MLSLGQTKAVVVPSCHAIEFQVRHQDHIYRIWAERVGGNWHGEDSTQKRWRVEGLGRGFDPNKDYTAIIPHFRVDCDPRGFLSFNPRVRGGVFIIDDLIVAAATSIITSVGLDALTAVLKRAARVAIWFVKKGVKQSAEISGSLAETFLLPLLNKALETVKNKLGQLLLKGFKEIVERSVNEIKSFRKDTETGRSLIRQSLCSMRRLLVGRVQSAVTEVDSTVSETALTISKSAIGKSSQMVQVITDLVNHLQEFRFDFLDDIRAAISKQCDSIESWLTDGVTAVAAVGVNAGSALVDRAANTVTEAVSPLLNKLTTDVEILISKRQTFLVEFLEKSLTPFMSTMVLNIGEVVNSSGQMLITKIGNEVSIHATELFEEVFEGGQLLLEAGGERLRLTLASVGEEIRSVMQTLPDLAVLMTKQLTSAAAGQAGVEFLDLIGADSTFKEVESNFKQYVYSSVLREVHQDGLLGNSFFAALNYIRIDHALKPAQRSFLYKFFITQFRGRPGLDLKLTEQILLFIGVSILSEPDLFTEIPSGGWLKRAVGAVWSSSPTFSRELVVRAPLEIKEVEWPEYRTWADELIDEHIFLASAKEILRGRGPERGIRALERYMPKTALLAQPLTEEQILQRDQEREIKWLRQKLCDAESELKDLERLRNVVRVASPYIPPEKKHLIQG